MKFASLGSGSEGNSLIVIEKSTCLLVDCGFSLREVERRLCRLTLSLEKVNAIFITHEHEDHVGDAFRISYQYRIPLYLTYGTYKGSLNKKLIKANECTEQLNFISDDVVVQFQDVEIKPFSVPHDAREPVQFTIANGDKKLGVVTDLGHSTSHVESSLQACHALVLECNHDLDTLMKGNYPHSLKKRISGRYGHLNNQDSAELLKKIQHPQLNHLIAAHLSKKNNTPDLARHSLKTILDCEEDWIQIADQELGFDWITL